MFQHALDLRPPAGDSLAAVATPPTGDGLEAYMTAPAAVAVPPAVGGSEAAAPGGLDVFFDGWYGPPVTHVRLRAPLSFELMVAVLAVRSWATREELATPAAVRRELDFLVTLYGMAGAQDAADRLAAQQADEGGLVSFCWQNIPAARLAEEAAWLVFCRQAVAEMLAAENAIGGAA